MSDVPSTTNQAATIADGVIHALIFDVAVQTAEAEIIAACPEMALPGVKQLQTALVKFIAGQLYHVLARGVTFGIIDAQTSWEAKVANDATATLRNALQVGKLDEIESAKKNFADAFGKLVHWDGSGPS